MSSANIGNWDLEVVGGDIVIGHSSGDFCVGGESIVEICKRGIVSSLCDVKWVHILALSEHDCKPDILIITNRCQDIESIQKAARSIAKNSLFNIVVIEKKSLCNYSSCGETVCRNTIRFVKGFKAEVSVSCSGVGEARNIKMRSFQ